ncbi:hypothetical protein [Emticicia sp. BO119]|uniref:hypothetical protein n=1 Tax=Emticicia sp. BO119 TaxID=2757768 RepID=UPI0015F00896|nr:hypothetical protein [Emticicia sp. BO119]MBA4851844.1 hypothetical protein [Emticicia sp. BO119]
MTTDTLAKPMMFDLWRQNHYIYKDKYTSHQTSYIENLLPEIAVQLNVYEILDILQRRLGTEILQKALDPNQLIQSPVSHYQNGNWLKKVNMVGINVRTIGNFFNVIKYALTIPESQNSIHLLPVWEPGVVGSLYGMTSFNINPQFFSHELASAIPQLNNVEKQLVFVVNVLHAMGKSVGMDVIPHTDRFSEMVIANPRFFEWIRRVGGRISSHSETLYREVEEIIWLYLHRHGTANGSPLSYSRNVFFSPEIPILTDEQRLEILFGHKTDYQGRLRRRIELMQDIVYQGYETLPMTMAPPYRGLHINHEEFILDNNGNRWYTYEFDEPQAMSRVFGPLARYKFYHSKDDNAQWKLDFKNPNKPVWTFFCQKVYDCQKTYHFDFMRGDMAHVQPRSDGVPKEIDEYYDPLRAVKKYIQKQGVPYFGFFAETFLVEPDFMGYGDELDHLEAIEADSTLGDLQSTVVGSAEYMQKIVNYNHWLKNRKFAPNYTLITADKDDPRFDIFYQTGNHLRFFVALFLTDMPSYMSLGFETRNLHLERGANEEYTKLYVFEIQDDAAVDKVTHGVYTWGKNFEQFAMIEQLRALAENIWDEIKEREVRWLLTPSENQKLMVWTLQDHSKYVFVANLDPNNQVDESVLKEVTFNHPLTLLFDTAPELPQHECRVYMLN